ncbi:HD-GYP domain-containing protein [Clostridium sp. D2Q-11]|uniref:HD-GYP domain-containing protein n=1 Tax=Anaeromonas frigoriresistens TaxID=2683708 RepID=A0A942Z7H8_9FIRM|nr:HD-GYP domain-containing protein [Anaeromonas frigoriresistens]MBS4537278.1 HD-GYP domain-containing protein [Anaeromonas frigoriresistens]
MGLIKVKDATPGMIISKDINNNDNNVVILASGTILNKSHLKRLKDMGINDIQILKEENEESESKIKRDLFFENHKKLEEELNVLFNRVKIGKKIMVQEISGIVNEIIKDISNNNNILGRLRQLKNNGVYIQDHSINVSLLATMIGKWLGYSEGELKQLSMAGLFHDIGMIKIPQKIIDKPGPLNQEEFIMVINHTINGYKILKETIDLSNNSAYGALQHHEREDGTGYPLGIKSNEIHEFGKIIAVCDVFNAMTSNRVYKGKESPFKVAEEILYDSFGTLDGRISTVFLNNISKFYIGNIVKLNNGSIGEIVYVNKAVPTRPVIKVDNVFIDLLKNKDYEVVDIID